jgi:hypothetical protein
MQWVPTSTRLKESNFGKSTEFPTYGQLMPLWKYALGRSLSLSKKEESSVLIALFSLLQPARK